MQSLFNGRPSFSESRLPASNDDPVVVCPEPHLLLDITPWRRAFARNLLDLLLLRKEPRLELDCAPGEFWPDVFVNRRLPVKPFWQSGIYHVFVVVAAFGLSYTWSSRIQPPDTPDPFRHTTITYYKISEYLPPIKVQDTERAKVAKKGDPVYAKQKIVSIRPNAESHQQTIIAPPQVRLPHDVRVPNIVASNLAPAPPEAMAIHSGTRLSMPVPGVVPPAPNVISRSTLLPLGETSVVPPAPDIDTAKLRTPADIIARSVVPPAPLAQRTRMEAHNLPLPSAVEPPIAPPTHAVPLGDLNVGNVSVVPPAPRLPISEQRARGSLMEGSAQSNRVTVALAATNTTVVPPSPSISSGGQSGGSNGAGRLIALGINPAAITGPINVPQGNRSGTFAAGPEGKPGATGTPEIKGGGTTNGPGGSGTANNHNGTAPSGIVVEPGATSPATGGVIVSGEQQQKPAKTTTFASLSRPSLSELAHETHPDSSVPSVPLSQVEQSVFGSKKYYSVMLNMPNLNSRGGSWIIRFAELNPRPQVGTVTAPVATRKVDPAYPSDLMRSRVEGTVILYAIIRANGSVENVRVLRGIDARLDENARVALAKWVFRPGTKNGTAVDIEAVVQIPFFSHPAF